MKDIFSKRIDNIFDLENEQKVVYNETIYKFDYKNKYFFGYKFLKTKFCKELTKSIIFFDCEFIDCEFLSCRFENFIIYGCSIINPKISKLSLYYSFIFKTSISMCDISKIYINNTNYVDELKFI